MSVFVTLVLIVVAVLIVRGVLKSVASKNEEKSWEYSRSAMEYQKNGNYEEAIVDFNKFFELNKNPYYTKYMERGDLFNISGNIDLAIADYTRVIDLGKKNVKISEDAEKAAERLGREGYTAITHTDLCNVAMAYNLRGDMYDKKGDRKKAIEDYNEAIFQFDNTIQAGPYGSEYYAKRGDVYAKLGHNDKLLEDYNKAIWTCDKRLQQDKNDFSQLHLRSKFYLKIGNIENAIIDLKSVMQFKLNKGDYDDFEDYNYDVKKLGELQEIVKKELEEIKK